MNCSILLVGWIVLVVNVMTTCAQADDLDELARRYEAQEQVWLRVQKTATTDEEWCDLHLNTDPENVFVDELLSFEAEHRGGPAGLSALYKLLDSSSVDPDAPGLQGRVKAIAILREHYINHPDLDLFMREVHNATYGPHAEPLLRSARNSPYRHVRAAACYTLARFLRSKGYCVEHAQCIEERPLSDEPADEVKFRLVIRRWMERIKPIDLQQWRSEGIQLCDEITQAYRDVPYSRARTEGTGGLRMRRRSPAEFPDSKPPTYGELAEELRFSLANLQIGQTAPEIVGIDSKRIPFKLSDYRGRVVLLIFAAQYCESCRERHPGIRKLQERFADEPFEVLAVMVDHDLEPVTKAIAAGDIRWRMWLDEEEAILQQWYVKGIPAMYLLDHEGVIQNTKLAPLRSDFELLELRICRLLAARSNNDISR